MIASAAATPSYTANAMSRSVLLAFMQGTNPRDFTLLPDDPSFEPFAIVCRSEIGHPGLRSILGWQRSLEAAKLFRSTANISRYWLSPHRFGLALSSRLTAYRIRAVCKPCNVPVDRGSVVPTSRARAYSVPGT